MTKTALPATYDPRAIEGATYARWIESAVFSASPQSDAEPYVIVIPPPNVTAVLHMGHGLNNTIQDVLIRFERMRGRDALWLPGTDHAGIATQNVVERLIADEGKSRHDLGRERFVERVWEYVNETGGTILEQLRAIGSSCDWSRTRFTFDERYSRAVLKVFIELYRDGLIYRGHRVIHWCPRCHTSLSDEEAEFHEQDDQLYYIKYRVKPATIGPAGEDVVVATTRPETMFGDVALVFHPEDERYAALRGKTVEIPLSGVEIPIATSSYVERDFGTGILKVTPAHDPNDFEIVKELEGDFEQPVIMTPEAHMADEDRVPPELRGLDRYEARDQIIDELRAAELLAKIEPYHHSVRRCYRCNTVIEPRLSDQWFVKMKPLAEPVLEAYRAGTPRFVPERWGPVYESWLMNIRDWNISRQLWWGHRIPAWYCETDDCDHITVAGEPPDSCERCGGPVHQDEDVLDTWFSSWLWPFATLGWPEQTEDLKRYYPGHTLVTGPDIIFFWVARMVMAGYRFMGKAPFETVYLNGMVRDPLHRAFSKSLGNGIDPLDVVQLYGADALRFTALSGAAAGTDIIMDRNDLDATFAVGRNFANKLWNLGRFILANLNGPTPHPTELDPAQFELADRWILSACQRAIEQATDALERFRLNEAASTTYHFVWGSLADWYVEQVKPRLYGAAPGGDTARAIVAHVFAAALKLLHPLMPFVTEELWKHLPRAEQTLLAAATWPVPDDTLLDEEAEDRFERVKALITAVRSVRAEYRIPPGVEVDAAVQPSSTAALEAFNAEQRTIERLAKLSRLHMADKLDAQEEAGAHEVLFDGSAVFVPLGEAIDIGKECARLRAEFDRLSGQLKSLEKKLANEQFVERAPPEVVNREREKERSWREKRDVLAEKLRALGC
ncbi:MAG: valine--tRNA ligase [Gemmatimonadales bacterium]